MQDQYCSHNVFVSENMRDLNSGPCAFVTLSLPTQPYKILYVGRKGCVALQMGTIPN